LGAALAGARMPFSEVARAMGERDANRLRYAAPTGTVVMRWDGARQPEIWNVPAPDMEPHEARLELARRYVHIFGPATPAAFATWAGIRSRSGVEAFAALERSLTPVHTPLGEAWILSEDAPLFAGAAHPPASARLLPSGDTWFLLQGADRELLVPEEHHRRALWTSRVWPGALLVDGETVGTWRRAEHVLTIQLWRQLSSPQRAAVEVEANSFPLPGLNRRTEVRWDDG
jgi:hypothetical protein